MTYTKRISQGSAIALAAVAGTALLGISSAFADVNLGGVTVTNANSASIENHVSATSNTGLNVLTGGNAGYGGAGGNGGSGAGNGGAGGEGAKGGAGGAGGGVLSGILGHYDWTCGCDVGGSLAGNGGMGGNGGNGAAGGNGGSTGYGGMGAHGGNGGTGGVIRTGDATTATAVSNDVNKSSTVIDTRFCGCLTDLFDLWSKDTWNSSESQSEKHSLKTNDKQNSDCGCDDQWSFGGGSSSSSDSKDSRKSSSDESSTSEMTKTHVPINLGDVVVTNANSASLGNDVHADSNTGLNVATGGAGSDGGKGGKGGSDAGNGGAGGEGAKGGAGGAGGDVTGYASDAVAGNGAYAGNGGNGAAGGNGGSTGNGSDAGKGGNGGDAGMITTGHSTTATAIVNIVNDIVTRITRN